MKKIFPVLAGLAFQMTLLASPQQGAADEALFLAPYLESELAGEAAHMILDAGLKSSPWMRQAAQKGSKVCQVKADQVENIPCDDHALDRVVSIDVGSHLERSMQIIFEDHFHVAGLGGHMRETARVLKQGGRALITAPASYDVVFTDGSISDKELTARINKVLGKIGKKPDPKVIVNQLLTLKEVQRATFVQRKSGLQLVTDEKELLIGELIWRKNPEGVESSYYHSEEEYLVAIKNAGLTCQEIKRPCFYGKVKYNAYSQEKGDLGEAYIDHNPFTLFYVTKS